MVDGTEFVIQIMKAPMKPGYLYGISEDGKLYYIKAKMPKPGETLVVPPLYMPKEDGTDEEPTGR